jgi:hypothetical protein
MSEQDGVPADGGQGAESNASPPVSPPAAPPPPPEPFYKSLKNAELRGYAEVKGFKGNDGVEFSETILDSYRNLEKLRGVPQERLLTLPENMEDAEAMKPIMAKLGLAAPEKAEDYGFVSMEGADPEFSATAQTWMHEIGVPPKMAQAIAERWNKYAAERAAADDTAYAETVAVEKGQLQAEQGAKYDAFIEEAKRGAQRFGLDEEAITDLQASIGFKKTMTFLNNVGKGLGEGEFVEGNNSKKTFEMSPEAARSELNSLKGDKAFYDRLMAGNADAKGKWDRLNAIAATGAVQ